MRKIIFFILFSLFSLTSLVGQDNLDGEETKKTLQNRLLSNSNNWAVGGGISNFIMHGDLRSLGTGNLGNFYNFGAYAYVDKMFNPLLGIEFKANYSKISGGAQYFSNIYDILYVNQTKLSNNLFFKGTAYGAELNLILSLSNLYITNSRKWHATGYFGTGYHQYDSALYEKLTNGSNNLLVNFGINTQRNSVFEASSIYLSAQLGIKYKLNKRVDLEFRPSWYFNYEDHLDATISNKQDWETFFVTHIGLVIKLGKKKSYTIWGDGSKEKFEIVDTDDDGVIDQLDKDPNTPVGVQVYGSGKGIDSDQDGIQDYKDKCPFTPGPVSNKGCPFEVPVKIPPSVIKEQIALLATSIYFKTDSHTLKQNSLTVLDDIIGLMKNIPDSNFIIEGHTDNIGRPAYNLKLSLARSEAVKEYFINAEIDNNRLKTVGYGQTRPRYSNNTTGARQLNRRVEIKPITKAKIGKLNLPNKEKEIKINSIKPKTHKVPKKIKSPLSEAYHTVKKGETLYRIASNNNTSVQKIMEANNLENSVLDIGQKIKIVNNPKDYHRVQKGETLYRIASDNNTSVQEIMEVNNLENSVLNIGQKIKVVNNSKYYHRVQQGETLYKIALEYQLSVEELKSINQLESNTIYTNQVLKIWKK